MSIVPCSHESTSRYIENGDGGNKPLPVTDIPGGKAIGFIISKRELKALKRSQGLSLVIMDDGSISLEVVGVKTVKEN